MIDHQIAGHIGALLKVAVLFVGKAAVALALIAQIQNDIFRIIRAGVCLKRINFAALRKRDGIAGGSADGGIARKRGKRRRNGIVFFCLRIIFEIYRGALRQQPDGKPKAARRLCQPRSERFKFAANAKKAKGPNEYWKNS